MCYWSISAKIGILMLPAVLKVPAVCPMLLDKACGQRVRQSVGALQIIIPKLTLVNHQVVP